MKSTKMMSSDLVRASYPITGLHCAMCASRAEQALREIDGVERVSVSLAPMVAEIYYDSGRISATAFRDTLQALGYELHIDTNGDDYEGLVHIETQTLSGMRRDTLVAITLGVSVMLLSMLYMHERWSAWAQALVTTTILVTVGRAFFVRAWSQLRDGCGMGMDTLIALSMGIAYVYSLVNLLVPSWLGTLDHGSHLYFESSAMVIAFVQVGKYIEYRARRGVSASIRRLLKLRPSRVIRLLEGNRTQEVDVASVFVGDRLLARAGEQIAVDGIVVDGSPAIHEQMLTGEYMPVSKVAGDRVYAGTLNGTTSFVYEARAVGKQTVLEGIIRSVVEAQQSKAPIQRLVDRISAVFVPMVLFIALLSLTLWVTFGGDDGWCYGLVSMLSVLVVACPCALGLATPIAMAIGIGRAAEVGLLIRDAESLEVAARVDTLVVDKTGTLTEGRPEVAWEQYYTKDVETTRALVMAIEQGSEHPLAEALVAYLREQGTEVSISHLALESCQSLAGLGMTAVYGGDYYYAGNAKLMVAQGIALPADLRRLQAGATPIYVASRQRGLIAYYQLRDRVRREARQAVEQLCSLEVSVHMLTGDIDAPAQLLSMELGIRDYKAEVSPQEKAHYIKQLQQSGRRVAMVGDGINDSVALAQADLSIAMGQGSDVAMEAAMVVIKNDDLNSLSRLIRLARQTLVIIKQNLVGAFVYNILAIPVAAGVLIPWIGYPMTPMLSSCLMMLSSLTVVGNSLRVYRC